jgi:putative SOS response-associated peptidase YedK
MCGRYASFLPAEALRAIFQTVNATPNWEPTWNMAPTRNAPVVRLHPDSRERHLDLLRWGLVPHWAKDPKSVRQPINARAETVATAPMFRDAMQRRRCLVPADAFYEWQVGEGGKQPFAIARADGLPLVFAGLWEGWRGTDGTVIRSFTIVTTTANQTLQPIHERMPVVLERADWPLWLGEAEGDRSALLRPSDAAFRFWPIATTVNNVRNDGPKLLEPLDALSTSTYPSAPA